MRYALVSALNRRLSPSLIRAVLATGLLLAVIPKLLCLEQMAAGLPERHWCFSDIKALYDKRGFDVKALPYADPPANYPVNYVFEYPPGLGLPAYALAWFVDTRLGFFLINAVTLLLAAGVAERALERAVYALRLPQWRLLLFAASPGLVVFALHTWDLWSVAPAAMGLAAAASGRRRLAGVLFGLGAAVKWWPALLLIVVIFGPWAQTGHERARMWSRQRLVPALLAILTWAVVQLPAIVVSPENWWASMAFHLGRRPNTDGFYGAVAWLGKQVAPSRLWGEPFTNAVSAIGAAGLLAGLGYIAFRLDRRTLAPRNAALCVVVLFLLFSKVVSPQFTLWLLPVAVISTLSWPLLLAVELLNIAIWFSLAGQFFHLGLYRPLAISRALVLTWILLLMLRDESIADSSGGSMDAVRTGGEVLTR